MKPSERSFRRRLPERIELVDRDMAEVFARMTGAQRLAIAAGMFESARRMLESHLRSLHPEWSKTQVAEEVARRLAHDAG